MDRARGSGSWEAEAGESRWVWSQYTWDETLFQKQQMYSDNTEVLLFN